MRRVCKDGAEQDALTGLHHYLLWRAGQRKSAKRCAHRRERRAIRQKGHHDDG